METEEHRTQGPNRFVRGNDRDPRKTQNKKIGAKKTARSRARQRKQRDTENRDRTGQRRGRTETANRRTDRTEKGHGRKE